VKDDHRFEVQLAGEMRDRYGLTRAHRPTVRLDPSKVPTELRHLIPLAEQFGISDDLIREDFLRHAPATEVEEMKRLVAAYDAAFDAFLAGPESGKPPFSAEYIAFTCLRMAADG